MDQKQPVVNVNRGHLRLATVLAVTPALVLTILGLAFSLLILLFAYGPPGPPDTGFAWELVSLWALPTIGLLLVSRHSQIAAAIFVVMAGGLLIASAFLTLPLGILSVLAYALSAGGAAWRHRLLRI